MNDIRLGILLERDLVWSILVSRILDLRCVDDNSQLGNAKVEIQRGRENLKGDLKTMV
jgi:hypothetical protein